MFVRNGQRGARACGIVGKGKASAFGRERAGFWIRDGVPVSYESVAGAVSAAFATCRNRREVRVGYVAG